MSETEKVFLEPITFGGNGDGRLEREKAIRETTDALNEPWKVKLKTLTEFFHAIDDSLGAHASRKGYSKEGADGENKLYQFTQSIGASAGHSCGEIIYKSTEYMKEPREVLLIKIAAWAFLEWKYGSYAK